MSAEILDTIKQNSLPDFEYSGGKIAESDWTRFAADKNIQLHITPIKKQKRWSEPTEHGFIHSAKLNTELPQYIDETYFRATIRSYKASHAGSRPLWAKLYSERGLRRNQYNNCLVSGMSRNTHLWTYENETFNSPDGTELAHAIRFADIAGRCSRVILITPGELPHMSKVRIEDKTPRGPRGVWSVTTHFERQTEETKKLSNLI